MDLLETILLVARQFGEFHAALAKLNGYSDRELTELGIARGDVARLAYEEAERRVTTPAASHEALAPAWQGPVLVPGR